MLERMTSGPFAGADGTKLWAYWHARPAAEPRGGVLIVHGYADHGGRYSELAGRLAARGLASMAFDYRGHGLAGGKRGHCQRFGEFLGDLEGAVAHLKGIIGPEKPVTIYSHSHGGLVTLRALVDEPARPLLAKLAGVVFSSPFFAVGMKVNPVKVLLGRVVSNIYPALAMPNGIKAEDLTRDAERLQMIAADRNRHSVATARWFTEATAAQAYVLEHADRLKIPSFWLLGGDDRVVDSSVGRKVYERAGGDKTLKDYPGGYHELWNDQGRDRVFDDVEAWLEKRFAA